MRRRFHLLGFDNPRLQHNERGELRLVCLIAEGGTLSVFGTVDSRENIAAVFRAEMPCVVECECFPYVAPGNPRATGYWVPAEAELTVLD